MRRRNRFAPRRALGGAANPKDPVARRASPRLRSCLPQTRRIASKDIMIPSRGFEHTMDGPAWTVSRRASRHNRSSGRHSHGRAAVEFTGSGGCYAALRCGACNLNASFMASSASSSSASSQSPQASQSDELQSGADRGAHKFRVGEGRTRR